MVTKGTYNSTDKGYEPKFVLAVRKHANEIGVCFFDVTTLQVHVGQITDDEQLSTLRTLVAKIRPVEVLYESEAQNSDFTRMLKNSHLPPVMQAMPPKNCWSFAKTVSKFEEYFPRQQQTAGQGANDSLANEIPVPLLNVKQADQDLAMGAFGMSVAFLEDALIAREIVSRAQYFTYSGTLVEEGSSDLKVMVLDSQALQHLEIVENA